MLHWFAKKEKDLLIAQNCSYSMNTRETQLNNNVLVVGSSGCGKTRSIVSPNIQKAVGSYIISDPKGNLYEKHRKHLLKQGYKVRKLDFINPEKSIHYNPLAYIHTPKDVKTIAHSLIYNGSDRSNQDPYWPQAAEELLTALIGYIWKNSIEEERTIETLITFLVNIEIREEDEDYKCAVDVMFEEYAENGGESWIVNAYKSFSNNSSRTKKCIRNEANTAIGGFDFPEINQMMRDDGVQVEKIGQEKQALFVVVSDNDRSMDILANLFFTQAIHELCSVADTIFGGRLPIHVRFIMDDFATNVKISDFPRMISSFRSREISCMLIIQAESQLVSYYHEYANTVITNCDTYVYLGGSDIVTARNVGERAGYSMRSILYMPIKKVWVFRRGCKPVHTWQLRI